MSVRAVAQQPVQPGLNTESQLQITGSPNATPLTPETEPNALFNLGCSRNGANSAPLPHQIAKNLARQLVIFNPPQRPNASSLSGKVTSASSGLVAVNESPLMQGRLLAHRMSSSSSSQATPISAPIPQSSQPRSLLSSVSASYASVLGSRYKDKLFYADFDGCRIEHNAVTLHFKTVKARDEFVNTKPEMHEFTVVKETRMTERRDTSAVVFVKQNMNDLMAALREVFKGKLK